MLSIRVPIFNDEPDSLHRLLHFAFLRGPFGPLLDGLCACNFIPMNQQSQVWLKGQRLKRVARRAELCAAKPANLVRLRAPRPRTLLVQFVAHRPEVLPVRIISFR